jgi:hypothetical protein
MFNELKFSEIKARGWVKEYLKTQSKGLTGNIGKVGAPFSLACWEQKGNPTKVEEGNFLGGINSKDDSWVPFEQNGYWIDGAIRTGRLIDDEESRHIQFTGNFRQFHHNIGIERFIATEDQFFRGIVFLCRFCHTPFQLLNVFRRNVIKVKLAGRIRRDDHVTGHVFCFSHGSRRERDFYALHGDGAGTEHEEQDQDEKEAQIRNKGGKPPE